MFSAAARGRESTSVTTKSHGAIAMMTGVRTGVNDHASVVTAAASVVVTARSIQPYPGRSSARARMPSTASAIGPELKKQFPPAATVRPRVSVSVLCVKGRSVTAKHCENFKSSPENLVSRIFASWNQLDRWLHTRW